MVKTLDKVLISFSGGRTSGYMTHRLLKELPESVDARIVFANTGQEDERTLQFVHDCENNFGWDITWVEAEVHHGVRKGTTHKQVDFHTASRDGKPFEQVISKYGLPNQSMPHCTRELKLQPIKSLCREWGWKRGDYQSAVGIRADEIDRMSAYAEREFLIYPLIGWSVKKPDVLEWWRKQNFDLNLPEHRGNCTWCWKKSFKKLVQVYREDPNIFDFPLRMERQHGHTGALAKKSGNEQTMFRGNRSAKDVIQMSKEGHVGFEDPNFTEECAESCEVFSDTSLGYQERFKFDG
jgi:3'-phosphoadenosine 5'-phosphosulfate sulfotransferase (PAPS reductase)/FAD synthetase